jgi:hypothetical protein
MLGAEVRIDAEIVINAVTVVGPGVIFEDR